MKDIGKILLSETDIIINQWIEAVRQDFEIKSAVKLTYNSVRDSIPNILEAIATLLSQSLTDQPQQKEKESLDHGLVRAEQGYDVAEIMREFLVLRKIILAVLKPHLLSFSPTKIFEAIDAINTKIDEVISISLESYVERRLQELQQLQNQVLLANQELTRLVQTQKDNLSHLSHELKNPINAMMGFSSLLLQKHQQLSQRQDTSLDLELIERVLKNGQYLMKLINNVLEISRYEAGQVKLNLIPTNVSSLIKISIETLESLAYEKNLEFTVDYERAPKQVITDPLRLQQIVTNLVSNAIRYTDSGTIKIICKILENDQWLLLVSDSGRGISPEDQERIFEPYFCSNSPDNYSSESTGLGLAIVSQLVKLLQGKIELISKVGEGSTFAVTFPLHLENI
ncbi:MAG: sensor histidine kinase [Microcoleaceae cyanobacterium]